MHIAGVCLDIEGVLLQEGRALPGAAEAVEATRAAGLPLRCLTNTTTTARAVVLARLNEAGIGVDKAEVLTPAAGAAGFLETQGITRVHLAAAPELARDFASFDLCDTDAGAVVMGDLHRGFDWDRLNGLYRMLDAGAVLIALHKNRYCRRGAENGLDLGPFVAALEYASGQMARVFGKPSGDFFASAVGGMGLEADKVVMVGDDIEADIGGALAAGLKAVQVRTGKYTPRDEEEGRPVPDARIASIADLPALLDLSSRQLTGR